MSRTLLHWALHYLVERGMLSLVTFLVNMNKIPLNQTDNSNMTLLHYACKNRKIDVIQYLVKLNEIDLNSRNNNNETILHISCDKISYLFE